MLLPIPDEEDRRAAALEDRLAFSGALTFAAPVAVGLTSYESWRDPAGLLAQYERPVLVMGVLAMLVGAYVYERTKDRLAALQDEPARTRSRGSADP